MEDETSEPKQELTYSDVIREHKITAIAMLAVELAQVGWFEVYSFEALMPIAADIREEAEAVLEGRERNEV